MAPPVWPAGGVAPRLLLHALRFDPDARANAGEASALAAWLAARGTPVHVVAAARPGGRGPRPATTRVGWHVEEWEGIRISRCPLFWAPPHARPMTRELEGASFALSSVPVLLHRAKSLAPDIVACFEAMPSLLAATLLAARRARARSWLHLSETAPLTRDRSLAALAARFDHVSLAAIGAEERLADAGVGEARRIALAPAIDTRAIHPIAAENPLRAAMGLEHGTIVALYAGSLGDDHHTDMLADIARRLPRNGAIVIVASGKGPGWTRLAEVARELPPLRLLPWPPAADLNILLNLADIHLMPDGFGAVDALLHAKSAALLSSGLPILAADDPAAVPPSLSQAVTTAMPQADALAAAIVRLAAAPAERIRRGAAARRAAQDYHEKERVFRRLERALELRPSLTAAAAS